MSSFYNNISPANVAGQHSASPEMFYGTDPKLDTGSYQSNSHNMYYENESCAYGFNNYQPYPFYDRINSQNPSEPVNLVGGKQNMNCANGNVYNHYQNVQNFGEQGQTYTNFPCERTSSCSVKTEQNCIPTPPPSYPPSDIQPQSQPHSMLSQNHQISNVSPHNQPYSNMNGYSHHQNMTVYPWMRSISGGKVDCYLFVYVCLSIDMIPNFSICIMYICKCKSGCRYQSIKRCVYWEAGWININC